VCRRMFEEVKKTATVKNEKDNKIAKNINNNIALVRLGKQKEKENEEEAYA